ncbi:uncharacterized protein PG986_000568 [Apiospora aurea]|uniref:Uncharacterized protein n=1 Tax=Apiospora aurea TaxID=335848 RepID=A0ABR1QUD9_9PEZI
MHATNIFLAILGLAAKSMTAPIPAAHKNGVAKRFEGGWCTLHLRGELGDGIARGVVKVYDNNHFQLHDEIVFEARRGNTIIGNVPAGTGGLPQELRMNIFTKQGPATFEYGDQRWDSGAEGTQNDRCKVGKYDAPGNPIFVDNHYTVDLDCGFSC